MKIIGFINLEIVGEKYYFFIIKHMVLNLERLIVLLYICYREKEEDKLMEAMLKKKGSV